MPDAIAGVGPPGHGMRDGRTPLVPVSRKPPQSTQWDQSAAQQDGHPNAIACASGCLRTKTDATLNGPITPLLCREILNLQKSRDC